MIRDEYLSKLKLIENFENFLVDKL